MKITDLDRRRAIKRHPEFKKDNVIYGKLKTEDEKIEFQINFLEKWGYEYLSICNADKVAKHRKDTSTVDVIRRITDKNDPYVIIYEGEEKKPIRLYGKNLYLKVRLEGTNNNQIIKDFEKVIKPFRDLLPKERNRKTGIEEGVWKVYDLHLETGKNTNETTRRWFSISGNPRDSHPSYLEQIRTAVSNAKAMIAAVTPK